MSKTKKTVLLSLAAITLAGTTFSVFASNTQATDQSALQAKEQQILRANPSMDPKALDTAIRAYSNLRVQGKDPQQMLTLIDYNDPSFKKRLWVIDMKNAKVEYNTYVAQGKGTGLIYAKHFSDKAGTDASSLGVYLTGNTYEGEHGYSMRLHGLDKGFNDNAYKRAVVMHSAWYVGQKFVKAHGYTGRSWGCTALSQRMEPKVVKAIEDGTVLVGYYPDKHWLDSSKYTQKMA
ncbi:MAG: hypothetical protein COV52_08425 [Gammaproteobacteria bacterium CG11_big_fil_rev_8_21_14_0_20_46_22]|nr:MAG: hypothetical protein COW05_05460 [Gammaproteobacteria bacterium CG12_big_fil_rev_8_21_14_0_65_46_12]PIR10519.1 MAG: hypothetical protein COV52_08425 [Gammaproteobacteria bacterium CG11_big_fil_rev_8_21_14_0_20_46_22]